MVRHAGVGNGEEVSGLTMKGGTCPKCKSDEVYVDEDNGNHGVVIPVHFLALLPTKLFICADCVMSSSLGEQVPIWTR